MSEISKADAKAVFRDAAKTRANPTGMSRFLPGLKKDKIEVTDLQKAWASAGFPDDTRDISNILLKHGFDKKEVKKIFDNVFGADENGETDAPTSSPTITKIAEYAKKNGIDKELAAFMKDEYQFQESYEVSKKLVVEDIRQIFTAIVQEERTARVGLLREYENEQLGRRKK